MTTPQLSLSIYSDSATQSADTVLGPVWPQTAAGGGWVFMEDTASRHTLDKLVNIARQVGPQADIAVVNFFDPENSQKYCLLRGEPAQVAARLLNLLPPGESNPGSDYFKQTASYALTAVVGALQARGTPFTVIDLCEVLISAAAMRQLENSLPEHSSARVTLTTFMSTYKKKSCGDVSCSSGIDIDMDRMKQVVGCIAGRITVLSQGNFGKIFSANDGVDLRDVVRNSKKVYIVLPGRSGDSASDAIRRLIQSDLREAVRTDQPKGVPGFVQFELASASVAPRPEAS